MGRSGLFKYPLEVCEWYYYVRMIYIAADFLLAIYEQIIHIYIGCYYGSKRHNKKMIILRKIVMMRDNFKIVRRISSGTITLVLPLEYACGNAKARVPLVT